jgi:hypothetical protein
MKPSSSKVAGIPMRSVTVAASRSALPVRRSRIDFALEATVSRTAAPSSPAKDSAAASSVRSGRSHSAARRVSASHGASPWT